MKLDFTDQVVAVTGVAGNLGMAVANAFAAAGAGIAFVDRSPDRLSRLFPELAASPNHFIAPPTDVTDVASVAASVEAIHQHFGRIDALVNTAGGYRAGTPLHETPVSDWDFMLNLNARSAFAACRAVVPKMLAQRSGKIINVSSRAALHGDANHVAYSISKTAIVRLTESLSEEVKREGINVNCVMPGLIDTPQNRAAMPDADFSNWVSPEAIAEVVLFLASDAARAIHGAAIPVYGRS
ncbi:MAG TPA: SDR family NAD(P)-dependent oxidoreductase [Blastocatellia bacterium]|nr:SDR family NAD(P)-dependent oxidoreductase [Blastocatellia bacterium]HMV81612.1 SDR family NAD(P)-dependent oxidoreductase [Blastocatellia bacterium]HMZ23019.1 SDR family NAD(P)-dependent oxidoreductase [Blastocatellia bacterium]HNG31504.1 SDR family NAD(P)-dependent oxidoreductase [Blastocatellia bacterium]